MKLKDGVIISQVENEYVAVFAGEAGKACSGMMRMNLLLLWNGCSKKLTKHSWSQHFWNGMKFRKKTPEKAYFLSLIK